MKMVGQMPSINEPLTLNLKNSEESSTYTPSTIKPKAEVKNNKWNGGVKQVEDYLEILCAIRTAMKALKGARLSKKMTAIMCAITTVQRMALVVMS